MIIKAGPKKICLEASTVCTLSCPLCPTAIGETHKKLGRGFLSFDTFKKIVDDNPRVYFIELSNWGEVFLNRELIEMARYAYQQGVALSAGNGANMNIISEEMIEALVRYKFRKITCSIDGASGEVYSQYRVNGDLDRVIKNIETINRYKEKYNSFFPILHWRFIIFGHNAHEIKKAREMAGRLNMSFSTKLSWGDLYSRSFAGKEDRDLIRKESGLGVSDREEFKKKYGREYNDSCCTALWTSPYINYDGRLLGCSINYSEDYGNILDAGLEKSLEGSRYDYAKGMLAGRNKAIEGIACTGCRHYKRRLEERKWIGERDIRDEYRGSRGLIRSQNRFFRYRAVNALAKILYKIKNGLKRKRF
jgi:MoaA/NifB/PqqE/SkfB family radical SAM enzyme